MLEEILPLSAKEEEIFNERIAISVEEGKLSEEEAIKIAVAQIKSLRVSNQKQLENVGIIKATDLLRKEIPPIKWVVTDFLPQGLIIIASKPKIGKSWLCLQLGICISGGVSFLNKYPVVNSGVIYFALEDTERRLQDRINKLLPHILPDNAEVPDRLNLSVKPKFFPLKTNDLIQLESLIETTEAQLIIIDTFAKGVYFPDNSRRLDYITDYKTIVPFQELAHKMGVSIILVFHTTKKESENYVYDEIQGTIGISGASDTNIILKRIGKNEKIFITGKDVHEEEILVHRNKENGFWSLADGSSDLPTTPERMEILELFSKTGKEMSTGEIAKLLHKNDSTVSMALSKLVEEGLVVKLRRGIYKLKDSIEN